jgi:hypothetical protein
MPCDFARLCSDYNTVHCTVLFRYMHPHFALAWFGYPFKDISYWVGLVFTLGCVAWVVNGHYALYTVNAAAATSEEGALTVAAVAALIGGGVGLGRKFRVSWVSIVCC